MEPTVPADKPEREEKPVSELERGQWVQIVDDEGDYLGEGEVLHVETFDSELGRRSLLLYGMAGYDPDTLRFPAEITLPLLTEAEKAERRAEAERAQKIADIRALADWLEANPDVPMPYTTHAYEHWSENPGDPGTDAAMATIRNLGQMYDIKLDEHLDDRTRFIVPFGTAQYELVVWHKDGRPAEPAPEPEPEEERCPDCGEPMRLIGLGYVGHIPGEPCSPESSDPTGFDLSRPADGDEPQQIGQRVEPHVGGVTDEGLVDETGWRDEATGLTSGGLVTNCAVCGSPNPGEDCC